MLGVKQARETAMDVLQKAFDRTDARVTRNKALLARSANTVEAVAPKLLSDHAPKIEASRRDAPGIKLASNANASSVRTSSRARQRPVPTTCASCLTDIDVCKANRAVRTERIRHDTWDL